MISFDFDFFPRENARGHEYEQFDERFETLLGCLWRHGNIVGDYVTLELQDRVQARVLALAPDALDEANLSEYGREELERLRALTTREPEFVLVEEKQFEITWCLCQTPSFRLLYSRWDRLVSPVVCGDCWRDVPLYCLPLNEESSSKEHSDLTQWLHKRENFEMLWLYSGDGEREAYRQLARPRSPFMKSTRQLAGQLEARTGVPTFAFLKHYYKKWDKHCPLCGRKWKGRWPWKGPNELRFRCDHCRLISEEPLHYRLPLSKLHP